MATYFYVLITLPEKTPSSEKRVGVDASTDTDAVSWITSNDSNYTIGTTQIYLRKAYTSEASDRGFATHDGVGASTDTASSAGGVGSLSAKLRYVTTQLDTMSTTLTAIKTAEQAFTSFAQATLNITTSASELKAGGSILSGRRGLYITNTDNGSNSIYIGGSGVTTSGSNKGREIAAGERVFDPFGSVARYAIATTTVVCHVEEVA